MINNSELNPRNYIRIWAINCLLTVPLTVLFAWPYTVFCSFAGLGTFTTYGGALLFALPFMLTILHGHVTLALGAAHRHHYYGWLQEHPWSYGLLFRSAFTATRFRLLLLALSAVVFVGGYLFGH